MSKPSLKYFVEALSKEGGYRLNIFSKAFLFMLPQSKAVKCKMPKEKALKKCWRPTRSLSILSKRSLTYLTIKFFWVVSLNYFWNANEKLNIIVCFQEGQLYISLKATDKKFQNFWIQRQLQDWICFCMKFCSKQTGNLNIF